MKKDGCILWTHRIIRTCFYLLFLLVPLILTPWNYELFEFNKMMLTYGLTGIILGAWVIKMIAKGEIAIAKTPLDIPLAFFFGSQLISSIFSIDPHLSWFGYYSRFNGGMFSVISYIILFYAFVSNMGEAGSEKQRPSKSLSPFPFTLYAFLRVIIIAASVVALYAVLQRFGIDKHLWVQDVQNRVFSSLGQPNWLATYLAALLPLSTVFALIHLEKTNLTRNRMLGLAFWTSTTILFFLVLLFTRSRSGLLAFAGADVVFWILMLKKSIQTTLRLRYFFFIHVIFGVIIFFNGSNIDVVDKYLHYQSIQSRLTPPTASTTPPEKETTAYAGPLLEYGGTESGKIRSFVWQAAITAWYSAPKTFFIGTGTETFALAFFQHRPSGHNLTSEWDFLYNKAHNEYLNYLATTGILGLGSYLILIASVVVWFSGMYRSSFIVHRKSELTTNHELITFKIGIFSGWLSLLISHFFGFSVVLTALLFFLIPGFLFTLTGISKYRRVPLALSKTVRNVAELTAAGLSLGLIVLLVGRWQADVSFATGFRLNRSGKYEEAKGELMRSIAQNPGEPLYHDELTTSYAGLALLAAQDALATKSAEFIEKSLRESDKTLSISPMNVNFWKTKTKVYYSFASIDESFLKNAIESLATARSLSPNDPKILYNLAILYGKNGNYATAIELLREAQKQKENYRDAYYALFIFYKETQQNEEAEDTIRQYLTRVNADDAEFIRLLGDEKP
ncbi:MAG: O-antigen ligase family protein [bacterium]|nr:O-antigen ligase family protein [bacterium]